MALTFINIHGTAPAGETVYCKMRRDCDSGVQVHPAEGATATVHVTLTDTGLWGDDGAGAVWEPVGENYEFTEDEIILFEHPVSGVRIKATAADVTIDVLGGRP